MIQEFLIKAKENLEDARIACEQGRYNASANRAYYAAFQAAIAALADEGLLHERNPHEWVQAQFSGILITRRKRYSARLTSMLATMQKVRDKADYKTLMTSKSVATTQLLTAQEYIASIVRRLEP